MHRAWKRSIKYAILAFLLLDAAVVWLVWAGIPLRSYRSYLPPANEVCGLRDWFHGYHLSIRIALDADRLRKEAKMIRRDEQGFQFWETPVWNFWVPKDTRSFFVDFVAAQFRQQAYDGVTIHPGAIVLDLGGFVGDYAKFALDAGASKVVTVEPNPEALECIRRNLATEIAQGRVVVYPKGVWDKEDRLFLVTTKPDNPAGAQIVEGNQPSPAGVWVPLTTVDKLVEELNLPRVDVIKMDIEGAEVRALRGARNTLQRFRPALAVATEHTDDIVQNTKNVMQTVSEVAGFYRHSCGYSYMDDRKRLVTETMYFLPSR
jgi:FkbM family methyltransferase